MPGNKGLGDTFKLSVVVLLVLIIFFGFSPISRGLLRLVHGSFAPSPYSSLALASRLESNVGVLSGRPVDVLLTNQSGRTRNYYWSATQIGKMISEGQKVVGDGRSTRILIPTKGAKAGRLLISLRDTSIFVTVTVHRSAG
jgi:hypothetical protein